MNSVSSYIQTLAYSLRARERGDEASEDALLEELDEIWLGMTPAQIATIDLLTSAFVQQLITIDDLEDMTRCEPLTIRRKPLTRRARLSKIYQTSSPAITVSSAERIVESAWLAKSALGWRTTSAVHTTDQTIELSACQFATA